MTILQSCEATLPEYEHLQCDADRIYIRKRLQQVGSQALVSSLIAIHPIDFRESLPSAQSNGYLTRSVSFIHQ